MLRGFNSDINIKGFNYHVQTEDWGHEGQIVITRVFLEGAVVKTVKRTYRDIWSERAGNREHAVNLALREQHQNVIDQLSAGRI
jgi:hypothetical protein